MIRYTTSDDKHFVTLKDAERHEAELDKAKKEKEEKEKQKNIVRRTAYLDLLHKIQETQDEIKKYNEKYNEHISFTVKTQFNDYVSGNTEEKSEKKPDTASIKSHFDGDLFGLNDLLNMIL